MFIQIEETPNPNTLKFIPGVPVLKVGTAEFLSYEDTHKSPLAAALFDIEGVRGVFLGGDFLTITKDPLWDWVVLKANLIAIMMDYFVSHQDLIEESPVQSGHRILDQDDEIVSQIIEILDTKIRPSVAQDGGDITFYDFKEGIVYLQMRGACAGCPSSTITLKSGIENMLKHYIPEVLEVCSV